MAQDFIFESKSSGSNEPKTVGDIFNEMLLSDSNFAFAYRKIKTAMADGKADTEHIFQDAFPNTELGVDLKLYTRQPGRMEVGASLVGIITHDSEDHYTFAEHAGEMKKGGATRRNPHVYVGKRINVIQKEDGTLYPTFNRPHYDENFSWQDFCREAALELYLITECLGKQRGGLVEESSSK